VKTLAAFLSGPFFLLLAQFFEVSWAAAWAFFIYLFIFPQLRLKVRSVATCK
jgi:hypothetical protein